MKRLLISLISLSIITGCGKAKKAIDQITSDTVTQDSLSAQGCSSFNLTHPEVSTLISCETGEVYMLLTNGELTIDVGIDISLYLEYVNITNDNNYMCSTDELLINGSFEDGHNLGNNKWGVFLDLPGWSAEIDIVDAPIEIQNGNNIGGIAASDGTSKMELDSHNKNGYTESDALVSQILTTTEDKVYSVKFDYSARVNNNAGTNRVEVYWNNNRIASLNSSNVGWETYTLNVVGIDLESKLSFRAVGDNDTLGGYIDNVSVQEICE